MAGLSELLVSSAFIVLCCVLAQVARKVLERFSSIHGLVKELILEAIAAAELCSTCFELIIGESRRPPGAPTSSLTFALPLQWPTTSAWRPTR